MQTVQPFLGIMLFLFIAFSLSENKKKCSVFLTISAIFLQFVIALLFLKIAFIREVFLVLNKIILAIDTATQAGTTMVFGYLGGGTLPFQESYPGASFILAFKALPIVLVMSALSSLLFYWKIMPAIVRVFSHLFQKTMRLSGAESFGLAANIFIGMVEAPIMIRPYLLKMTRSQLFSVMTCGMATIAGTVMVLYATLLTGKIPDVVGHILVASIISVPATVALSKLLVPEQEEIQEERFSVKSEANGSMDAIVKGTADGLQLYLNIIAMLIVLVAIVALINTLLGTLPFMDGELTLEAIFGTIMAPVAWLMGIPWQECQLGGQLLGLKTVLNEFIAYLRLGSIDGGELSLRSRLILTYALCGFANPGSLGIMLGGLCTLAPERKEDIVPLGLKSLLAGTMATCMTGAVIGVIM